MRTIFDVMKINAKYFDTLHILAKDKIIFCDSESVIIDYLILKANYTDKLPIAIVTEKSVLKNFIGELFYRIDAIPDGENNFDCQVHNSTVLKFDNGSFIMGVSDTTIHEDLRGFSIQLLYIRKNAVINASSTSMLLASTNSSPSRLILHAGT